MSIMTVRRSVVRVEGAHRGSAPDDLAVEAPLSLVLDGPQPEVLATIMRTPGHDLELAAGWLLVESGVQQPSDVLRLREGRHDPNAGEVDTVAITLAPHVTPPRPRAFVTSASCGVCSADILELALRSGSEPHSDGWTVRRDVLAGLPEAMRGRQRAFDRTGGVHAAAMARADGRLVAVREDVGRHNAVDKVAGRALFDRVLPATDHLLVVSGRVSFEIVQKAVAAGVAGIVAVSAPSSLAVDLAREYGLILAGLVRGDRLNVYAGDEFVAG